MAFASSQVLAEARALLPSLRQWRRSIHRYPELGFHETRTAALVAETLERAGWIVTRQVARTGVVGVLRGPVSGPVFALRADMDALPIQEQNRVAYRSQTAGVMHACGHDGNTAMALGAAVLLARNRDRLRGAVKVIFQPCEETPPGGAQAMIQAGVLRNPDVNVIIAGHIDAGVPAGKIALRSGPIMAATDAFNLTIQGKGGHGAFPHRSIDAVAVAGQVLVGLQAAISREQDPLEPAVLTVGQIQGGTAFNVIADTVRLRGTLRSLTPGLRRELPRRVERIAAGICRAYRASCRFECDPGHPALNNQPELTLRVRRAGLTALGARCVLELARPAMTGEDFTYFAAEIPACFFHVGGGNAAKGFAQPWHHPRFDFDETGLAAGCAVMVQAAREYLA